MHFSQTMKSLESLPKDLNVILLLLAPLSAHILEIVSSFAYRKILKSENNLSSENSHFHQNIQDSPK